jgi:hypothetical protein
MLTIMKNTKWLGMLGAIMLPIIQAHPQPAVPQPPADPGQPQVAASAQANLAPAASEVVHLSESGTTEDIILAYIQRSTTPFNLSADQIVYLKDIGLSSTAITAMLNRDRDLQSQGQVYTYDQKLYPSANPAAVAPQPVAAQPVAAPAPEPAVATPPPATQAPVYVSSPPADVTYFYSDLSPYGTWVQLNGIGWCWQPRVVVINHGWRPYCDGGYWTYSDAGWYWQSTYSWGWAPFHYGRWQLHPSCGWVWTPDRVWGPAWVVWRSEGSNCGWAPLPPHAEFVAGFGWRYNGVAVAVNFDFGLHPEHYTFVAMRDFCNHDLDHRRYAPTQVTQIYNHTTIINNYVVNNNTIVNQGIKVDRVAEATHTQIHKVPIRDVPAGTATVARAQATPVIYRPQLKAPPARPATMVAQKVDDRHPVIQHAPVVTGSKSGSVNMPAQQTQRPDMNNSTRPAPSKPQDIATRKPYSTVQNSTPPPAAHNPTQVAAQVDPGHSPQRTSPEAQPASPRVSRPTAEESNPHQYYPKSYHQAAEVHSLPPINPRPNPQPAQSDRGNSQPRKDDSGAKH